MSNILTNMTENMTNHSLSAQEAQSNLKNGYIALAMTFFTTLLGYGFCVQFMPSLMSMATGLSGLLFLVVFIAMIFGIYAFRNSTIGLIMLLAFGALEGIFIAPLVSISSASAVVGALAGTAALAIGTSVVAIQGHKTGKLDSSSWGKFLFVALIGLIVAMVVNIFMQSSAFQMLISSGVIVIMSGMMIYDTQQALKHPRQSYIIVALSFYLNIINIFIHLLSLINSFEE